MTSEVASQYAEVARQVGFGAVTIYALYRMVRACYK